MANRLYWALTLDQVRKMRGHCARIAKDINDTPSFVYQRLIYSIVRLLDAGMSLDKIREGHRLLVYLHNNGCCCFRAKKMIQDFVRKTRKE